MTITGPRYVMPAARRVFRCARLATGCTLAALAVAAVPALAEQAAPSPPGVVVDPNSPAGKEYAIPLQQARGGSGGHLFGKGIARQAAAVPAVAGRSASAAVTSPSTVGTVRRRQGRRGQPVRARRSGQVAPLPAAAGAGLRDEPRALPAPGGGDATAFAWVVGTAVLVLALGLLAGEALGRHGRRVRRGPA